jgi:hypothetical protein
VPVRSCFCRFLLKPSDKSFLAQGMHDNKRNATKHREQERSQKRMRVTYIETASVPLSDMPIVATHGRPAVQSRCPSLTSRSRNVSPSLQHVVSSSG